MLTHGLKSWIHELPYVNKSKGSIRESLRVSLACTMAAAPSELLLQRLQTFTEEEANRDFYVRTNAFRLMFLINDCEAKSRANRPQTRRALVRLM